MTLTDFQTGCSCDGSLLKLVERRPFSYFTNSSLLCTFIVLRCAAFEPVSYGTVEISFSVDDVNVDDCNDCGVASSDGSLDADANDDGV